MGVNIWTHRLAGRVTEQGQGKECFGGGIGECGCKSTTLTGKAEMDWGEERDCG